MTVSRSRKRGESAYVFPLSFAQEQLWLVDRLVAGRPVYNVSMALRLVGSLDSDALQRTLQELLRRHEALRTRFETENGVPMQVITAKPGLALEAEDLSALPAAERETEARRRAQEAAAQRFDLERGPLFSARLLRLGESEHWLLLTLHHIVTDGWSSGVMRREISALYEAFREGRPSSLPELPIQYADYAVWQRESLQGAALDEELAYWRQALAALPVLELPTDRPRPAVASYRGGRVVFELDAPLTAALKALRQREGTTLFMTLLAAFQVLLYRYSGQDDIAVGVPIAGRSRPELEGLIGYFVNMLVLRGELSGEPSFRDYLARVRRQALAAYAHQELPFARLVEELAPKRDASRNPLFQVSFALENTPPGELRLAGLDVTPIEGIRSGTAKFDLDWFVTEQQGKISVGIEYASDLFDASTIERMAAHWRVLLEAIVADPEQSISRLPLLTKAERQELCRRPTSAAEHPSELCIHELFEAQVRRAPDATALVFEEQTLSYAELNAQANQVAHRLRALGVGPDVLVALAMDRSIELIVGLLGILKAGGAYLPLDPSYPAERLAFILEDTQAPVLLTQRRLLAQLPGYAGRTLCLDRDRASIAAQPRLDLPGSASADHLAYCIYTSGSTGQPKGTLVTHRNVVRLLRATEHWFGFNERDVWTLFHSFAFDFSVWEMWGALLHGGKLVIVPYLVSRNPEQFRALLARERVTVLNQTPSAFSQLLVADGKRSDATLALRLVIFGGEALDVESLRPWFDRHGDGPPRLVNMYGITETTVHVTYRPITRADAGVATSRIGEPIPDMTVVLLDRHGQPVPAGIPGEIFVGGAGVARGYLNRPELTAERFVPDPFSDDPTARLYRSGDLARRTTDGDLEYLGRIDQQVKIRGYRIELVEIEAALKQHEAVQDAVVAARESRSGEKRLVAYVVAAPGCSLSAANLRAFLLGKLPDYMVPAAFASVEALPLTVNGKIDRARLASSIPELERAPHIHVAPRNAVEVQLMRIWEKILDVSRIGMRDNFFALGGDSLGAVRMIDRIEQLFGRQLPLDILWYREGTIESLARVLVDEAGPPLWSGPVPIKATGTRRPLFCPHIVGGHLFFYDNLAHHMIEDQPVYGLPARGVDGKEAPDSRVEAMAANCIRSMRQVQPRGPYRLAGYCSGGMIAFEMARQLHAQGDAVELLALCDSLAPGFHPLEWARTAWEFVRLKNVRLVQQRLYRFVLQNLGLSRLRKFRTVTEAHYWAQLSYRPRPYPGRAVLIRAADTANSFGASLGWNRFAKGGVDVCTMPAGHGAMVKEPMVRVLAEKLETYLGGATGVSHEQEIQSSLVDA